MFVATVTLAAAFVVSRCQTEHRPAQSAQDSHPTGVVVNEEGACEGYTLFSPVGGRTVYLLDLEGEVAHEWVLERPSSGGLYLLEDSNLLAMVLHDTNPRFQGPGAAGGEVVLVDWESNVLWRHVLSDERRMIHHDVEPLPDGHILVICWEHIEAEQALAWGRDPAAVGEGGMWFDALLELAPRPQEGADVVWEWHASDHLVQDLDPSREHFGSVPEQPGRIDINADHRDRPPLTLAEREKLRVLAEQMRALGYAVGDAEDANDETSAGAELDGSPDWLHTNAVDHQPEFDLVVLSTPHLNELWVIDHSTTTAQAASGSGGRFGHGGEILWRWGNPRVYGAGDDRDRKLFYQHDPTWLLDRPGELRLLVFNNGGDRPGGAHSSLDELLLPFDPQLGFLRDEDQAFEPAEASWTFARPGKMFSPFISGAQRLRNGNTLACSGVQGLLLEVTPAGEIVWEFHNPHQRGNVDFADGPPANSIFRATRLPPDHPGLEF